MACKASSVSGLFCDVWCFVNEIKTCKDISFERIVYVKLKSVFKSYDPNSLITKASFKMTF
jgi:hypothetical protein